MVGTLLLAEQVTAATITLNYNFEFSGGTNPTGASPWLRAVFDDSGGSGAVKLTLTSLLQNSGEFVSDVTFNVLNNNLAGLAPLAGSNIGAVSAGAFALPSISYGADAFKPDGDGTFDIQVSFATAGAANNRFGQSDVWSVTFMRPGLTVADFSALSVGGPVGKTGFLSAAHVQGIPAGTGSGWLAPVPVPAAALLFLSGLAPLAPLVYRRTSPKRLAVALTLACQSATSVGYLACAGSSPRLTV